MTIRVELGFPYAKYKEISRIIYAYPKILDDLTPLFEKVMKYVQKEILQNFLEGGRPKWAPLSEAYIRNKQMSKSGNRTMISSGRLFKAATKQGAPGNISGATANGMKWGVDIEDDDLKYAAIQQLGGIIPAHTVPAYKTTLHWIGADGKHHFVGPGGEVNIPDVRIPARPYIKLSKEANAVIMKMLHMFLYAKSRTKW